jgi:hypothetical protein
MSACRRFRRRAAELPGRRAPLGRPAQRGLLVPLAQPGLLGRRDWLDPRGRPDLRGLLVPRDLWVRLDLLVRRVMSAPQGLWGPRVPSGLWVPLVPSDRLDPPGLTD